MTNPRSLPSVEVLRAKFSYDEFTGELRWKSGRLAGKLTGQKPNRGYLKVFIDGTQYFVHRVIWKMVYGTEPDHIDHIDGRRSHNAIANIRSVVKGQNNLNCRLRRDNKSGCPGVSLRPTGVWRARIKLDGRDTHLGHFKSCEEAVAARKSAERMLGFSARHGSPAEERV